MSQDELVGAPNRRVLGAVARSHSVWSAALAVRNPPATVTSDRSRDQHHTSSTQQAAHCFAKAAPNLGHLLQQYEHRQTGYPKKVHNAADEQQRHQEPAASYTVSAMPEAHTECS